MKITISEGASRTVPTVGPIANEEISEVIPTYNGADNSNSNEKYEDILAENQVLMAGADTYDEIDGIGKLYLNGAFTGNTLYKHPFSVGLYGGNKSDFTY